MGYGSHETGPLVVYDGQLACCVSRSKRLCNPIALTLSSHFCSHFSSFWFSLPICLHVFRQPFSFRFFFYPFFFRNSGINRTRRIRILYVRNSSWLTPCVFNIKGLNSDWLAKMWTDNREDAMQRHQMPIRSNFTVSLQFEYAWVDSDGGHVWMRTSIGKRIIYFILFLISSSRHNCSYTTTAVAVISVVVH